MPIALVVHPRCGRGAKFRIVPEDRKVTDPVVELAQERLRSCPYPAIRRVQCRFLDGQLVLTGEVPTFYMKQVAQTVVKSLEQVEWIDNRIVVST